MIAWHHQLDGHKFEQAPGDGEGQGSLAYCRPWGHKESNMTEQLNDIGKTEDFPGGSGGKASVYNAGDLGSIPGSGRFPGEGNGNPLQYSCLENSMNKGAWCRLLSMGSQRIGHD